MCSYPDRSKRHSVAKTIKNEFICRYVAPTDRVAVIDGAGLKTAIRCARKLAKANIHVINSDPAIIARAKRCGFAEESFPEHSTSVMWYLRATWEEWGHEWRVVYLDYCGTPHKKRAWDPAEDLAIVGEFLPDDGLCVVTFSRRCPNSEGAALAIIPDGLELAKLWTYCESSSMMALVVCRKGAKETSRRARLLFEEVVEEFPRPHKNQAVSFKGRVLRKRGFCE